jgi:hypothetical protein
VFYRNNEQWVANFVAKNRHYRVETATRKFRINRGILSVTTQAIALHRYDPH